MEWKVKSGNPELSILLKKKKKAAWGKQLY